MDLFYLFIFAIIIMLMIFFILIALLFIIHVIFELFIACVSFFRERNQEKKKDTCTICLNEVKAVPLACGHVFHKKCINEWLKENSSCPNCREKVIYLV